jgi:hypothetical protein
MPIPICISIPSIGMKFPRPNPWVTICPQPTPAHGSTRSSSRYIDPTCQPKDEGKRIGKESSVLTFCCHRRSSGMRRPPPYRPRAKRSSRRFWEERGFATQERGRVEVGQKERGAGGIRRSGMDAPSRGVGRSLVGWMERGDGAIGG